MRLLVLDQTHILPWIVERELPERADVEVISATRLEEAERLLREAPPDAAVVSLPPARVDWKRFHDLCRDHRPPIPVLLESCVEAAADELGFDPETDEVMLLPKPVPAEVLRVALLRLLELAEGRPASRPALAPVELH